MSILIKIVKNEHLFEKVYSSILSRGCIRAFDIQGEEYLALIPFQVAALQYLGVSVEFYTTKRPLEEMPYILPEKEGVVEKLEGVCARAIFPDALNLFVSILEKRLAEEKS